MIARLAALAAFACVGAGVLVGMPAMVRVADGEPITGRPAVTDGDSLRVGSTRIRLAGMDAPELHQTCRNAADENYPCGLRARAALTELVGGELVACFEIEKDRYGRTVARCWARGLDLSAEMVRQGHAITYGRSPTVYAGQQEEAKRERRGIWQGAFMPPEEWRRWGERQ